MSENVEILDREKILEKELEEFVKKTFQVKTIHGETLNLPRVGWAVEAKVLKTLSKIVKGIPNLEKIDWNRISSPESSSEILQLVTFLCEEIPDEITKIVSLILNKDSEWVENNLDLDGILDVLTPFFYERRLKLKRTFSRWWASLEKVIEAKREEQIVNEILAKSLQSVDSLPPS